MPNVFSTTDSSQPGYFRIGYVVLQIPPTDISTNRIINDDQISTIRGISPMFIKSGQARWDVTVVWKALRFHNDDGTTDYSQWVDLRTIVAMFKAAPFVEVENAYLRQHFTNVQLTTQTQRMAFALRQIRIDTNPDSEDVLDVTLTMSLFNYVPYSKDFGYQDENGDSASATDSTKFKLFISNWISRNMDNHPGSLSSPPVLPWNSQDEGVTTFLWREYTFIPFNGASSSLPPTSPASAAYIPTVPPSKVPKRVSSNTVKLSDSIQQIINAAANKYGLDPAVVTAQCIYESQGNPNAVSRTGAVGLLQLLPSTAQLSTQALKDPQTNAEKGCQYLAQQLKTFGNYPHALGAYNAGPAYIYAYRDGKTQNHGRINPQRIKTSDGLPPAGIPNGEDTPRYVKTILTNAGYAAELKPDVIRSTDGVPPKTQLTQAINSIPDSTYQQQVLKAVQSLPNGGVGWFLDYYTEQGVFFFYDHTITLASADSPINGDFDMFPNQVSIVMVNNLPLIPLASMQYPTYQHVGPPDTMISISFNSVGDDDSPINEPFHGGIQALAAMSSQLEEQFQNLRTLVRAVSSIHRMQAVFIQNKVLNMLGINGTMLRGLNTETVPEASDLVQVSIMASQYENIFEESSPYRINGIPSAYKTPIANILTTGQISKLSPAEQQSIAVLKSFADKWAANDANYLLSEIFSIVGSGRGIVTATTPAYDILTDMANSTDIPNAQLRPDQQQYLLGNLDLQEQGTGVNTIEVAQLAFNEIAGGLITYQRDTYPGLEKRRQVLNAPGKTMSFADFFVFSQLPEQANTSTTESIQGQEAVLFASQLPTIIQAMYAKLFDWEMRTNPIFSREAQLLTNSPFFASQFNNTVTVDGPSSDPNNLGHECYKDLGLTGYKQDPAFYFVDYNEKVNDDTNGVITQILGTSNQSANSVNQIASVYSPGDPFKSQTGKSTPFSGFAQALPGQANSLIRMTHIPGYDMADAYPTFKLMLIEEDNTGPFFAFDNFYSYASVQDIEIIKYQDKPDTAIIQITNLAHLLQHRLFDDSAAGKLEKEADKFNNAPFGALTPTGEVVTGGGSSTSNLTASKTAAGADYQLTIRKNMTEGRDEATKRVPLKYFALQTGAKIQVRMGFSNNPDNLYPVFTGFVTQIDGDDILTITAQSFQLELMNIPGTLVKTDSYLGFNFLSGGAAFGGYQIMNSGTTTNILQTLLTAPTARHFGHWQIGGIKDPLIKGFTWSELVGNALSGFSNSTVSAIGNLLQSGYDRSGENILVNSIINLDASQDISSQANNSRRTFQNENPNVFLGTAAYSIPKQSKMNLWEIMKDVSRRYPWYNLMVRAYGFPYGADATLVYAHPLDWYYSRPRLLGETEKEAADNINQGALFQQWWNSTGHKKWTNIFTQGIAEAGQAASQITTANIVVPGGPATLSAILSTQQKPQTQEASSGPEGFTSAVQSMHNILNGLPDPNAGFLTYLSTQVANFGNISGGLFQALDAEFQAIYREWETFLHLSDPASNSSRLRPVRQYHLIDHSHIVHNGIVVNDNIYNAVKIKDRKPLTFNQNIPQQHIRCLDVTDMINNVDTNVLQGVGEPLLNAYAQSFLREEVGKMYQGELVIRGVPEIEPFDVILLSDPSTSTVGPIEVDTVIHSFNITEGFITIVKPKALLIVNEACSLGLIASLGLAWSGAQANLMDLGHIFNPFSINTTVSARALEAAGGVGGALALSAGLAFATTPVGIGVLALVAGLGIMVYAENQSTKNMFQIMPLSRFGRPWLGGLQGFQISNFAYSLNKSFQWFDAEEIAPTVESWNELLNYRADILYPAEASQ